MKYKLSAQTGMRETVVIEPLGDLTIEQVVEKMNGPGVSYQGWFVYASGERDPIAKIVDSDRENLKKPYEVVEVIQ
jgi:hypothetical protein